MCASAEFGLDLKACDSRAIASSNLPFRLPAGSRAPDARCSSSGPARWPPEGHRSPAAVLAQDAIRPRQVVVRLAVLPVRGDVLLDLVTLQPRTLSSVDQHPGTSNSRRRARCCSSSALWRRTSPPAPPSRSRDPRPRTAGRNRPSRAPACSTTSPGLYSLRRSPSSAQRASGDSESGSRWKVALAEVLRCGKLEAGPIVRVQRSRAEQRLQVVGEDEVEDDPRVSKDDVPGLARVVTPWNRQLRASSLLGPENPTRRKSEDSILTNSPSGKTSAKVRPTIAKVGQSMS